ncbi:Cna B-type domain-containing protein [Bacillus sp. UNC322MFChir4.1]|nr:Cna B-type domain-containing protein [Bacillus sp. UNC322MFChir4.1]
MPIIANAQELNTAGLVDRLDLEKTDLQSSEWTQLTVNFSEKDRLKLKPGDTLTLTLPPELHGFPTKIQLSDYGECKVTGDKVICTFNDKVNKHQNIKGSFYLNVQATNVGTDEKKEIETNFGTNLDKQTITITGPTGGGGTDPGEQPFFYKTGDTNSGQENVLRWFLNINLNKDNLSSDIVVNDNLHEGQTLNKDSFKIHINNGSGVSPQAFEAQGYGTITFNGDKSFKVVINKDKASGNAFSVWYTSTLTEAGKKQDYFKNDYQVDYQVTGKKPASESGTFPIKNMAGGGTAEGDKVSKGTLRIVKHLEGNEEKVIPNVKFKLYKASGEQVGDEYITDEKGIIEIKNLTPGKYYVQEVSAPNYIDFDPKVKVEFEVEEDAVNGIKLPISNKVKTTSIAGTKTWNDNNASDRPSSIKVDLLQNGQKINTKEVTAATNWKYEFTGLAVYDADGKEYKYEVKEQPVNGYESKVNGYDITNTKAGKVNVEGTKTWKDNNAADRPSSIQVELFRNGEKIDTKEVTAAINWKYTFADLPAYDANGKAYTYTVKEQSVPGYESKVNGYDITNTKVGKTKVEGIKTWKDNNATNRPSSIKVDLLQNGKVVDTKEVSAATSWKYTFDNLQAYDANGVAYKYEVKEQPVPGYESKVNGYDITNTKVGKTSVTGMKTWKGGTEEEHKAIKVDLLQNGQVIDAKEVSAATNWMYTFDNLQAYDANGVAYKYEVKEQPVPGYESKVDGFNITNTKVGKVNVEGTKTWNDNNATDRPSSIKIDLYQNGTVLLTQYVTSANDWKYTFADLPAYDAKGVAYTYTVKEQSVPGYESKVNGYDITNTKVGETKVEGTKTWKDDGATDRPTMIKVDLLQNGKVVDTQEVTAATNWKYTFDKLPAYDANGVAYKYEVKEQLIDGYKSEVNGSDITNTKVGETKVEGTKTWKDDNAKDRPKMIKVDLLQNGKVIATKEVTAATNWKYTFENLPAYDAKGVAYKYEVKEQPVDGYKSEVNGSDITNTKVGETKVEGTKTWKDDDAKDRPKMIKVDLLQNGQVIDTKEVSAATNWKYTFENLPAYDAEGKAYKYEVKEQPVDGYKSEVNGYDITNTKTKGETGEDPKDPNKGPNEDPKDSSNKENDKTTVLLPKTGGTPAEMISIVGGMVLFVLGGILFARQRMKQ